MALSKFHARSLAFYSYASGRSLKVDGLCLPTHTFHQWQPHTSFSVTLQQRFQHLKVFLGRLCFTSGKMDLLKKVNWREVPCSWHTTKILNRLKKREKNFSRLESLQTVRINFYKKKKKLSAKLMSTTQKYFKNFVSVLSFSKRACTYCTLVFIKMEFPNFEVNWNENSNWKRIQTNAWL